VRPTLKGGLLSKSAAFQKHLGEQLATRLDGFKFYRSKLELSRKTIDGTDVILLSGSSKWSPLISVSFYFGRRFDQVMALEKRHGEHPMPCHIQQYSLNLAHLKGINYVGPHTWEVDICKPSPLLATELTAAIQAIAFPFFERFSSLQAARDAIATNDPWCFGSRGPSWISLFKLDAAMGDLAHFRRWSNCLEPFYSAQAKTMLRKYDAEMPRA